MARLSVALPLTLALLAAGCAPPRPEKEAPPRPKGPAHVAMAVHITNVHGVRVGADDSAEIAVTETNGCVRVAFTPRALERVDPSCLRVLGFDRADRILSKRDYLAFLDQLHAFFMLTPVKPKEVSDDSLQ